MIIVVEGADGSGKSTVAEKLAAHLGCEVITFPNDQAFTGPLIRSYLRKEWAVRPADADKALITTCDPSALVFQALNVANRMELMPYIRQCRRSEKDLVICRYWQSAYVYGQIDGLPKDWLGRVHATMIAPDLSLLVDAPNLSTEAWVDECMRRRSKRDGDLAPERYEGKRDLTTKVINIYRDLWAENTGPSWATVDASGDPSATIDNAFAAIAAAKVARVEREQSRG